MTKTEKKLLQLVNLYREHGDWSSRRISEGKCPLLKSIKIQEELLDLGVELDIPEEPEYIVAQVGTFSSPMSRKIKNPRYKED